MNLFSVFDPARNSQVIKTRSFAVAKASCDSSSVTFSRRVGSRQNVYRTRAQPGDERLCLRIVVQIEPQAAHLAALSSSSASAQARLSSAMSASISAALASE